MYNMCYMYQKRKESALFCVNMVQRNLVMRWNPDSVEASEFL